jgi:hypothetical protein
MESAWQMTSRRIEHRHSTSHSAEALGCRDDET